MEQPTTSTNPPAKTPVQRGARACTVCRQAKMKCVGAEDGTRCQRCQRAGVECVFEKHRRGRKPGSKLSEASKMLRRLEKGLNNAKAKQPATSPLSQSSPTATPYGQDDAPGPSTFPPSVSHPAQQYDDDMDEDEDGRPEQALYPEKLIRSSHRSSFLDVVMNPEPSAAADQPRPIASSSPDRPPSFPKAVSQSPARSLASPQPRPYRDLFDGYVPKDPVAAGLIPDTDVGQYFDLFYLRLNPFINLFDPSLHSAEYVRRRSPFLFTTMLMASCKFFRPSLYPSVKRLAEELCAFAFIEGEQSVETAQAFACLTYWSETTDRRTWSYIGMACRMALNLRLNKYVGRRQPNEEDIPFLERRNRERTYLVLFVHDRSLAMQTGKPAMLTEDELVRNARTWHEDGCMGSRSEVRPEDVIVAAFVQLRLIGSEGSEAISRRTSPLNPQEMTSEYKKQQLNSKLDDWHQFWLEQMRQCSQAHEFHNGLIQFFQSHVRLFLNTYGLNLASIETRVAPNPEAVHQCYQSARTSLQVISEFDRLHVVQYCQESVTIMTAYAAIVLLKLLRSPSAVSQLPEGVAKDIHDHISRAADAYQHAGHVTGSDADSAVYHARFLHRLVTEDMERTRQQRSERGGFRQDGIPPLFAQGLPPLRVSQGQNGVHAPQTDPYALQRPAYHSTSISPLSVPGPAGLHPSSGFMGPSGGGVDTSSRTGFTHNSTNRMTQPSGGQPHLGGQGPSDKDARYWNWMFDQVGEVPWDMYPPENPSTSNFLIGSSNPNPPMHDMGFPPPPPPSQYRESQPYPPPSHSYGAQPKSHLAPPHSQVYLPPVQSFAHAAYDGPR
ncbi:fungal-specific transcription factor domain-containing protein [Trametes elegans]|nr:fungal-specific transcription factor domain-containing protein [Trametes elegans]